MAYTDLVQLTDRFGERALIGLTDRGDVFTGTIDTDVIDRAITDAAAVIDGYLKARYQLPLAAVPALVSDVAAKITYYNLHTNVVPDKTDRDYHDAIALLKEISRGLVQLDVAGVEPAAREGDGVRVTDRERPFTEDNLKGFI